MAPWLANVLGIALGGVGLLFVVYALVADRAAARFRPRRLCPACRYNMVATQGRTCSECGHTAKSERRLTKGRTLRRTAAVGVLLLFVGYGVRAIPGVQERGWPAAVPTVLLIAALPQIHPDRHAYGLDRDQYTWREKLFTDLDNNERMQSLWRLQEQWLVRRCLRGDHKRPFLSSEWEYGYGRTLRNLAYRGERDPHWLDDALGRFEFTLETRAAWPADAPVYVVATFESWIDYACDFRVVMSPRDERLVVNELVHRVPLFDCFPMYGAKIWPRNIGTPPADARSVIWDVQVWATPQWRTWQNEETVERHVRTFTYEMPISIEGHVEDHVNVVTDPEIGETLRSWLAPGIKIMDDDAFDSSWSRDDCWELLHLVDFYDHPDEPPVSLAGITAGVEVELLRDGEVVRIGTTWFAFEQWVDEHEGEAFTDIVWRGDLEVGLGQPCMRPDEASGELTVRLRGLPHIGLRNFEATAVWAGEVVLPLSVQRLDL